MSSRIASSPVGGSYVVAWRINRRHLGGGIIAQRHRGGIISALGHRRRGGLGSSALSAYRLIMAAASWQRIAHRRRRRQLGILASRGWRRQRSASSAAALSLGVSSSASRRRRAASAAASHLGIGVHRSWRSAQMGSLALIACAAALSCIAHRHRRGGGGGARLIGDNRAGGSKMASSRLASQLSAMWRHLWHRPRIGIISALGVTARRLIGRR